VVSAVFILVVLVLFPALCRISVILLSQGKGDMISIDMHYTIYKKSYIIHTFASTHDLLSQKLNSKLIIEWMCTGTRVKKKSELSAHLFGYDNNSF
jgi:hypothetical protein